MIRLQGGVLGCNRPRETHRRPEPVHRGARAVPHVHRSSNARSLRSTADVRHVYGTGTAPAHRASLALRVYHTWACAVHVHAHVDVPIWHSSREVWVKGSAHTPHSTFPHTRNRSRPLALPFQPPPL